MRKRKKGRKLKYTKRLVLVLMAALFVILVILLLLPKRPESVKGVTYDLKYPRISHHSQVPRKVFENDFRLMKQAGINTIRLYGVPPEFVLDLADRYGMKVIETIVFPGDWTDFTSPYQLQALKREALRNISRDIDRECIYAWSIWNDAPWTYGSGKGDVIRAYGKERVSSFLKEIYETVKKRDPLRPVTAATLTINEDAKELGADFLDILGYNVYLGVTDWRDGMYDPDVSKKMVDELVSISSKYGKPVLITETGYSTYWVGASQEDVIRDQVKKAAGRIKGVILFQWADDWSKAGEMATQNNDVEEHWGLVEGERKLKKGYYAAKSVFRNTAFKNALLAVSDYFRGGYFAAKKRALRKKWKEDVASGKEIDSLQNELNLKPDGAETPDTLEKLAEKFFEKNGFDQFASFLREHMSSHKDTGYEALMDYYIALAGWSKLEYLAETGQWQLYYAEKERTFNKIMDALALAEEKTRGSEAYVKVLYLEWLIHNDMLIGKEDIALEKLEQAVRDHSESEGDAAFMLAYSKLLEKNGELQLSRELLQEYSSQLSKFIKPADAAALLKNDADIELEKKNFQRAKILYDAYMNTVVRNSSEEEASFAILELANLYKRRGLLDEAIEACERLLKEFPSGELADDADYARAAAIKEKKAYSAAIKAFRDFIVDHPDSDLSKSAVKEVLSIFTVYGKGTRAEKTVSFLKEIVALYPDNDFSVMARFELASSLVTLGKDDEAAREYQYIIDNHPDSDYADYSITSIERLGKGQ